MRGVILAWGLIVFIVFSLSATAEEVIIQVGHKRLEPSEVSISTGGTVTFHNQDEMPGGHTIMADDCSFKSPSIELEPINMIKRVEDMVNRALNK